MVKKITKTKKVAKKQLKASKPSGLEQLFGSKTRYGLLKLFYKDADREFFVRELARATNNQLNAVRREVANLENMGIIKCVETNDVKKKFYALNTNFVLYSELSSLILGSSALVEKALIEKLEALSGVSLCIFTSGIENNAPCDILIVGNTSKGALAKIINLFEVDMGKDIAYTVFDEEEYLHRKDLTDRFLFTVFEKKRLIAIDKNGEFSHESR